MFKNPGSFDVEAMYQCFAENEYGTSVSDKIHLVKAQLKTFDIFDTHVRFLFYKTCHVDKKLRNNDKNKTLLNTYSLFIHEYMKLHRYH